MDFALTAYIVVDTCGDVYNAKCNCVSGAGCACSRIAALPFALEEFAMKDLKELPVEEPKTSTSMELNKPPKKVVQPSEVVASI